MHPATESLLRHFAHEHLSREDMRTISKACGDLAREIADSVPDGPEKTAGLRKLLEAKDCFVRAAL